MSSSSDEGTGTSSLPAVRALTEPNLPIRDASNDLDLICIPETPSLPLLDASTAIPGSAHGRSVASDSGPGDRTGCPKDSNFEGFCGKNDLCLRGISTSSVTSEDEILTPAQRPGTQKYRGNFTQFIGLNTGETGSLVPDSSNLGRVVIVEPVADDRPVEKFFSNDIALSKALAESPFGRAGIAKFNKNLGRKLLVITLQDEPGIEISVLLNTTQLGSWTIKCRVPINHSKSVGVIGPMGEDVTNEELAEALALAGYTGATAERIQKGKEKTNTSMFKVTLHTSTLPTVIQLGYQRFQVNPYTAKPWQCFNCQRFGHSAISCRSAPRCVKCGGAHSIKDCTTQGPPCCCNCGGEHTASYGGCKFMKEAQMVEKVRAQQGTSYRDAHKAVQLSANNHVANATSTNTTNRYLPQPTLPSVAPNEPRTWAQKVKFQHNHTVQTVSTGTQTQDDPAPFTLQGITVNKFIELMCKIISACNHSDNLDIVKTVTDLTKETLNHYSPVISCTDVPISAGVVPQPDPSTRPAQGSTNDPSEATLPMDVEGTEAFPDPSPVIGKRTARASHRPTKPGGNQGLNKGKSKCKGINSNLPVTKDKTSLSQKCPTSRN